MKLTTALIALCISLPATASRPAKSGELVLSSSNLETVQRDAQGRTLERFVEHFNADGYLTGTSRTTNHYTDGRLVHTVTNHYSADGEFRSQLNVRRFHARDGRLSRILRRWTNADDQQTRRQQSVWDYDHEVNMTLVTTTTYDADDLLSETRYTIHTYRSSRLFSSDTSVFDTSDRQKSRHYSEYRGLISEHWTFDAADEVTQREVQKRRNNARGQTVYVDAQRFNGKDMPLGSRTQEMKRIDAMGGALKSQTTTWFDTRDRGIRRMTRTNTLNSHGQVRKTRITWEHWSSE